MVKLKDVPFILKTSMSEVDTIKKKDFNKMIRDLKEAFKEKRIVYFVHAGNAVTSEPDSKVAFIHFQAHYILKEQTE